LKKRWNHAPTGSPSSRSAVPAANKLRSSPSFRSHSRCSKQQILSDSFHTKVPNEGLEATNPQTKVSKRRFPSEGFQVQVPKLTLSRENSQALRPRYPPNKNRSGSSEAKVTKRTFQIERSQAKDPKPKFPSMHLKNPQEKIPKRKCHTKVPKGQIPREG